jgi:hypothetical protein
MVYKPFAIAIGFFPPTYLAPITVVKKFSKSSKSLIDLAA